MKIRNMKSSTHAKLLRTTNILNTIHFRWTQADEFFKREAEAITRQNPDWDYQRERQALRTALSEIAQRAKKAVDVKLASTKQTQQAMQYLQQQQQQLQAIQQQVQVGHEIVMKRAIKQLFTIG